MTRNNEEIAQQKCQGIREAVRSALFQSAAAVVAGSYRPLR